MLNRITLRTVACLAFFLFGAALQAQEMVKESATGVEFPEAITISHGDNEYQLHVTGTAVRKKFFFQVYGVAHYMEDAGSYKSAKEARKAALEDGKAKEIVMSFVRDVGGDKIKDAFDEAFQTNMSAAERETAKADMATVLGYFSGEAKEDNQYGFRRLPGGVLITVIEGEEKPAVVSVPMAKALWSAWLGDDAVVDANAMVSRIVE